jgi:hypothetical protein
LTPITGGSSFANEQRSSASGLEVSMRILSASFAVLPLLIVAGCASSPPVTPIATPSSAPATATAAAGATPARSATAGALTAVAATTFPPCPDPVCVGHGAKFTTCDGGMTGSTPSANNIFSLCPFTTRLEHQLMLDSQGGDSGGGGGDPVGGGQDPEWLTEAITAGASPTGGLAEVTFVDGANVFRTELVIVSSGGQLLVDDIYCTGTDPSTTDAYAPGWDGRAACAS